MRPGPGTLTSDPAFPASQAFGKLTVSATQSGTAPGHQLLARLGILTRKAVPVALRGAPCPLVASGTNAAEPRSRHQLDHAPVPPSRCMFTVPRPKS